MTDLDALGEAMRAHNEAALANPPRDRWRGDGWVGFNTVSLGAWLDVARKAQVNHVPAVKVAEASVDDLLCFDTPEKQSSGFGDFWHKVNAARNEDKTILRWDHCATADIKHALGTGKPGWQDDWNRSFNIDDFRAYDLLYEYTGDVMPVWKRPWLSAQIVDGYPVEFRVFVENGKVVGISSYYPQRPLKQSMVINFQLGYVVGQAMTMLDHIAAPILHPPASATGPDDISLTMDFIVGLGDTEQSKITQDPTRIIPMMFLEGNPGFGTGSGHPCCFEGCGPVEQWRDKAEFIILGDIPVRLKPLDGVSQ